MKYQATPWDDLNRRIYWHRVMPLNDWINGINSAKPNYLHEAVKRMPAEDFVYYYGVTDFKLNWPRLHGSLPKAVKKWSGMLNLLWSSLMCKSFDLQPFQDFFELSDLERNVLIKVAQNPGISMDDINNQILNSIDAVRSLVKSSKLRVSIANGFEQIYPAYES